MIRNLLNKYRNTSDLNRFLLKGGTLFLLWRIFRKWMILQGQYTDFTQLVSSVYLRIAKFALDILHFETSVNYAGRKLWLTDSDQAIEVVYDCLGVNLFFVFIIFVLAYPGKWRTRLWYLPFGIGVIFLLNAMRMAALTPIVAYFPDKMDLFHHFIFQGIIYVVIFILWWIFTRISAEKIPIQ